VRRVIDAHHHLWDLAAREHRWLMGGQAWATDDELAGLRRSFTLADLAPLAAEAGVTGTVVIQTAAEPWETPDLLALAAGRDPYAACGRARGDPSPGRGPVCSAGDGAATAGGLLAGVVGWIGSDWPVSTLAGTYRQVCGVYRELTAGLSAADRDAIFEHTARRVYRLREPDHARQHGR
jgi:predicted TIM-barrel fold metal-dependent hydrolase